MAGVRPRSDQDEEAELHRIVRLLHEDKRLLVLRFESDIARYHAISNLACDVRSEAHALVRDVSEQGLGRHRSEEHLFLAQARVHRSVESLNDAKRPKWTYLEVSKKPTLSTRGPGRYYAGGWEDWVAKSRRWAEIDAAQNELLVAAESLSAQRDEVRSAAQRAISQMDTTVRRARDWSATFFAEPASKPRVPTLSALPLAVFLIVAFIGIWLTPDPHAGWIAAEILMFGVLASALRLRTRQDHRAPAVAVLAAGSAFSLFNAAYLVARLIEPDSMQRTSTVASPIGSIAEAAFASLTVGVTGGTIGIELDGAARVIAFIQILVSVGAVAAGVGWGWRRWLEHARRQDVPARAREG